MPLPPPTPVLLLSFAGKLLNGKFEGRRAARLHELLEDGGGCEVGESDGLGGEVFRLVGVEEGVDGGSLCGPRPSHQQRCLRPGSGLSQWKSITGLIQW